jgi:integrase
VGQHLTEKLIRDLPVPSRGNKIHYDDVLPGFGVRITATGFRSFILNYHTQDGRERRLTIGGPPAWNLVRARQAAADYRRQIDGGEDPLADLTAAREAPTIRDLAERFEREFVPGKRPNTAYEYRALLATHILPKLGAMKVAAVTHADIDRLHRQLSVRAPYRANRLAALLSKLFALAIRWKMRLDNPAQGLERNREEKRARYLSATELPRLLAAIHKHEQRQGARAILLLLLTGARRAEVLTATWNQFDLDHGVWTKPAASTKQKALHHVPLSNPAIELLKQIQQESVLSEFLFPARDGGHRIDIKKDWAQVCRAAGITGLRLHDLRHSYASMLVSAGLSLPIVGALLGHSQASTTQRYAHLADDPLRQATAKVGQIVVDAGRK